MFQGHLSQKAAKLRHGSRVIQAEDFFNLFLRDFHSLFHMVAHTPSHNDHFIFILIHGTYYIIVDYLIDFHYTNTL